MDIAFGDDPCILLDGGFLYGFKQIQCLYFDGTWWILKEIEYEEWRRPKMNIVKDKTLKNIEDEDEDWISLKDHLKIQKMKIENWNQKYLLTESMKD